MPGKQLGAVLGSHAKLWAALATGAVTFLMIGWPSALWARAAALGINAVLVYLVPNAQAPSDQPGDVQHPPGG